jgi:hypothetical protein
MWGKTKVSGLSAGVLAACCYSVFSFISYKAKADIPIDVVVSDPQNSLGSDLPLFLRNLRAAVHEWEQYFTSAGTVKIQIQVTEHTPTGRFSGSSTEMVLLGDTRIQGQIYHIVETSTAHKMKTGHSNNPGEADVLIQVEPEFMRSYYWIDPSPETRVNPVPVGKTDLVTILSHEFGHAMGMEGYLNLQTGAPNPGNFYLSTYDQLLSSMQNGGNYQTPSFTGNNAMNVYGSPVPITFFTTPYDVVMLWMDGRGHNTSRSSQQNIYHLGRFFQNQDSDLSFYALMAGAWETTTDLSRVGLRSHANALDIAVFKDLGIPTRMTSGDDFE